jgi:hypothetical protein
MALDDAHPAPHFMLGTSAESTSADPQSTPRLIFTGHHSPSDASPGHTASAMPTTDGRYKVVAAEESPSCF